MPFFNDLLGIIASLFVSGLQFPLHYHRQKLIHEHSGFSYIFPALMWFKLLKRGSWRSTWSNIFFSIVNAFVMLVGAIIFVCGLYACIGASLLLVRVKMSVIDVLPSFSRHQGSVHRRRCSASILMRSCHLVSSTVSLLRKPRRIRERR